MISFSSEQLSESFERNRQQVRQSWEAKINLKIDELNRLEKLIEATLGKLTGYVSPEIKISKVNNLARFTEAVLIWSYQDPVQPTNRVVTTIVLKEDWLGVEFAACNSGPMPNRPFPRVLQDANDPIPTAFLQLMDQYFKLEQE